MDDAYPNDADGDALRRVSASGSNMSEPMDVDFQIAAPDEESAVSVAKEAAKLGYGTKVYMDTEECEEGDYAWTCECTKSIVLTYDAVTEIQSHLDEIAGRFDACVDGWGTFGNVDDSA
jgi:regulator of RNase E activity RraB